MHTKATVPKKYSSAGVQNKMVYATYGQIQYCL